jgi:uracil-DNA glycosylase
MAASDLTGGPTDAHHRAIFRRLHQAHAHCRDDEWLNEPCRTANGALLNRPTIWSRRNGPWRQVNVLWIGAAPGNAGRRGAGALGAHGTRIPFGGDVAGANLEVLLGSIGINRNHTFILAALNELPEKGGGEPTAREILAPRGGYRNSIDVVRDSILACGPRLVVCLGNVAARVTIAAVSELTVARLPSTTALGREGWQRGNVLPLARMTLLADSFRDDWGARWTAPPPALLWLTHPSAQNMSPFAGVETAFHTRMREAIESLQTAAVAVLGIELPRVRANPPDDGIYALPEWRDRVAPRNAELDRLWREKGV